MIELALRQVPVDADACHWCGGRNGQHSPKCDVPRWQAQEAARRAGRPVAVDEPSSSAAYYEYRRTQAGL